MNDQQVNAVREAIVCVSQLKCCECMHAMKRLIYFSDLTVSCLLKFRIEQSKTILNSILTVDLQDILRLYHFYIAFVSPTDYPARLESRVLLFILFYNDLK